jgi:NhaP-type Na+/H+ or K+/H+ antiporter
MLAHNAVLIGIELLAASVWIGSLICLAVVVTALGIRQARSMTRLRRRHLEDPGNDELTQRVRRGARTALLLRGVIGVVSLATLAVVAAVDGVTS